MRLRHVLPLAALLASGCGGSEEPTPEAEATPTAAAAPTPTATATALPPAATWYRDVQPLVQRSCLRCHTDDGVGPGDFSTYDGAYPLAPIMAAFTAIGLMPPAAADPACLDYQGSDRMSLTAEERAVFTAWADAGAPLGDPADAPAAVTYPDRLADPDLILTPKRAYQPRFDATGNEYYCVILDPNKDEPFYINALDVQVDATTIVHHLVLYLDLNGDAGPEGAQDGDGFRCDDHTGDTLMLHAWAPGGGALEFPEGMGMKVEPHQRFVLQMHYYRSSPAADVTLDASGYALRTLPRVNREMYMLAYGPDGFTIPAGESAHSETVSYTMNGDLPNMKVWGSFPHMHLLGASYKYWIDKKNGEVQCLLDGPRWDFHNQLTYMFKEPISFRQGDTVNVSCTWNNSPSNPELVGQPTDVSYGTGTGDEMCYTFTYVSLGP